MPRSYQATPAGSARPEAGRKHDGHDRQRTYEPSSQTPTRVTLMRTYDPHGVPIDTPVWFALQGSTLLFRTKRGPKTRRIADRPEVELQACDHRGRPLTAAPIHRGTATELHGDEAETANRLLHRRYGWQWNVIPLIRIPGVVNVHRHLGWRERLRRSR